jgi:transcriptional regulator with XRE-family HTH domain
LNIGENIRNIRKNQKLTLKELGIKISLSEQAIGQYERGEREPNIETLNKIANALELSLSDLLQNTEPKQIDLSEISTSELINELHKRLG